MRPRRNGLFSRRSESKDIAGGKATSACGHTVFQICNKDISPAVEGQGLRLEQVGSERALGTCAREFEHGVSDILNHIKVARGSARARRNHVCAALRSRPRIIFIIYFLMFLHVYYLNGRTLRWECRSPASLLQDMDYSLGIEVELTSRQKRG